MLIVAYAAGARRCIICADSRSEAGIRRITKALEEMRRFNLVGSNILNSAFSCEVETRQTASSLVMREETALLRLLEGKQAMPFIRPPYPEPLVLLGNGALVDTIGTFAKASAVFQNPSPWFVGLGPDEGRGTWIITLAGDVSHPYVIELPPDTIVRTIVDKIGGGAPARRRIKAVQVGGSTGSLLGPHELDVPLESVVEPAGPLGSATRALRHGALRC